MGYWGYPGQGYQAAAAAAGMQGYSMQPYAAMQQGGYGYGGMPMQVNNIIQYIQNAYLVGSSYSFEEMMTS